jgi:hypothetical protein
MEGWREGGKEWNGRWEDGRMGRMGGWVEG